MTQQPLGKLFNAGVQRRAKARPEPSEAESAAEPAIDEKVPASSGGGVRPAPSKQDTTPAKKAAPASEAKKPAVKTRPPATPGGESPVVSGSVQRRVLEPTSGTVRGNRVLVVAYLPEALKDALLAASERDKLSVGGVLLRAVSRQRDQLSALFAHEGGDADDLFDSADYSLAPRALDAGPKVRSNFSLMPAHLAKIDELRREHAAPNFSRFVNVVLAEDLGPQTGSDGGLS